jgi:hypothetical protein
MNYSCAEYVFRFQNTQSFNGSFKMLFTDQHMLNVRDTRRDLFCPLGLRRHLHLYAVGARA